MKLSITAALILASGGYAQTIASEVAMIPSCALTAIENAVTGAGCGLTDYACQCGPAKPAIAAAATPTIVSDCTTQEALLTQQITAEICSLVAASSSSTTSLGSTASSVISSVASTASSIVTSVSSHNSSATSVSSSTASHTLSTTSATSATAATTTAKANSGSSLIAANFAAGVVFLAAFAL